MDSDSKVLEFMQLADCNFETAKSYVEMSGGDMNRAFELYQSFKSSPARPRPPTNRMQNEEGEDIPSPREQRVSNLLYDDYQQRPRGPPRVNLTGVVNDVMHGITNIFQRGGRNRSRGGQRRKPPQSKMLDGSPVFQELFAPPKEILFQGSFENAKDYAKQKKKWLLVNIQSSNVFACLELNRDCWKNELVKEFIQENFVFYQKDVFEDDGNRFQTLYMKGIYSFPYIGIIDPRTGCEEKRWVGKMEQDDLYNHLVEFIKGHSTLDQDESELPSVDSVQPLFSHGDESLRGPSGPSGSSLLQPRPPVGPSATTEDQLLQMAINESLKDAQNQYMVDEDEEEEEDSSEGIDQEYDFEEEVDDNDNPNNSPSDPIKKEEEEEEIQIEEEDDDDDDDKPMTFPDEAIDLEAYTGKNLKGEKTRVQLILPNGKREVVTILQSAPLATIYACFRSKLSEEQKKGKFQVVFFNRTLENTMDRSLQDDKVLNASLSLNFE